jgi:dolichyl-diphosphooligosaccharide--protein glycosyltransferase
MAVYGASSYVRLMITVAPFMTILAGYALTHIFSNIMPIIKQKVEKKGHVNLLSKGYGFLIIGLVVLALVPVAFTNAQLADHPAMIVSSSTSFVANIPDWSDALAWMRDNIPSTATVASWWDYGYWINVVANKTVIADNSTNNSTQIQQIAFAFLGNENNSLTIFKAMNVSYVVVYEPFEIVNYNNSYVGLPPWSQEGDFEKSTAMMSIAGYNISDYIQGVNLNSGSSTISWPLPAGTDAHDCLLYQLLFLPFAQQYSNDFGIQFDNLTHYSLVYASSDYWVLVYKITYN